MCVYDDYFQQTKQLIDSSTILSNSCEEMPKSENSRLLFMCRNNLP